MLNTSPETVFSWQRHRRENGAVERRLRQLQLCPDVAAAILDWQLAANSVEGVPADQ